MLNSDFPSNNNAENLVQ